MNAFLKYPMNNRERTSQLDRTDKLVDNIKKMYNEDIEQLYPQLL